MLFQNNTKRRNRSYRKFLSVFLLLISASILSFFIITNNKAKADVEGMSLSIIWYDSSINNGNTALESLSWNATSPTETRVYTQQVTLRNTADYESYDVGELILKVPVIGFDSFSIQSVSAGDLSNGYEWSYIRQGNYIVFTNNVPYEVKANTESSLQIKYSISASSNQRTFDESYVAILYDYNDNQLVASDGAAVSYHPKKAVYTAKKEPNVISGYDGLIANAEDYIWVRWRITFSCSNGIVRSTGGIFSNDLWVVEHLPEGALIYDRNANPIEIDANNDAVVRANNLISSSTSTFGGTGYTDIYVGYPKNIYANTTITNTIDEYVIYKYENESTYTYTYSKEAQLNDYIITPTKSYSLEKNAVTYNWLSSYRQNHGLNQYGLNYYIRASATYDGTPYNLEIGDDVLVEESSDETSRILGDDEYYFSTLEYYPPLNINGGTINSYDMDVYVRRKDATDYELFTSRDASQQYRVTFSDKNIVGWKIVIKNLTESAIFQGGNTSGSRIATSIKLIGTHFAQTGKMYNYVRLQANNPVTGELFSNVSPNQYNATALSHHLDEYDLSKYNSLQVRNYNVFDITYNQIEYDYGYLSYNLSGEGGDGSSFMNTIMEDIPNDEKFYGYFAMRGELNLEKGSTEEFRGFTLYKLLPKGIHVEKTSLLNKTDNIRWGKTASGANVSNQLPTVNYQTASGQTVTQSYLIDHTTVEVIRNYNNTGSELVILSYNFDDDPLNLNTVLSTKDYLLPYLSIKCSVTYDSYIENGGTYRFRPLIDPNTIIANDHTAVNGPGYTSIDTDDLNNNGDTQEKFYIAWNPYILYIASTVATKQDTTIMAGDNIDNYHLTEATIQERSNYSYKVRVRTGNNKLTNLVSYVNIEDAHGDNPYWKGTFTGVDTSYMESKGYKVNVYYSENYAPFNGENVTDGTLSDPNTTWQPYTESVNKNTVKALAFEYLELDNTAALFSEQSIIYSTINMKIDNGFPADTYAYCTSYARWNAIDDYGGIVDDVIGTNSNIVKINTLTASANLSIRNIINADEDLIQINKDVPFYFSINFGTDNWSEMDQIVILLNGIESEYEINEYGNLNFSLKHDDTLTFKYVPVNTSYQIESSLSYDTVEQTNSGNTNGTISADTDVLYVNTLMTDDLTPLTGVKNYNTPYFSTLLISGGLGIIVVLATKITNHARLSLKKRIRY